MKSLTDDRGTAVANALIRMENNADFVLIKSWIDASFEDIKCQLIDVRGENTLLAQGYADALRDITESFNSPRRILEISKFHAARQAMVNDIKTATEW